jgi:hypothetical protein
MFEHGEVKLATSSPAESAIPCPGNTKSVRSSPSMRPTASGWVSTRYGVEESLKSGAASPGLDVKVYPAGVEVVSPPNAR